MVVSTPIVEIAIERMLDVPKFRRFHDIAAIGDEMVRGPLVVISLGLSLP